MNKQLRENVLRSQCGGALLVALVMIFMLSIMGISAMRGSNLEQRMAINSIHSEKCLQIAESSTELGLNNQTNLISASALVPATAGDPQPWYELTTSLEDSTEVSSEARILYTGQTNLTGESLGIGLAGLAGNAYEVVGIGEIDAANVKCSIKQGAALEVAS